ncbi:hypothetical protein [Cellulomonas soli]|uniref:hypothetical protein n=1 Tax=Cellulomonas soli TaxID=931535 RepID=UPI0011BE2B80|nr:hypothetical protein [Cellulomonas soli]NYI58871.1 hypothetical protein [Cellulomonas soli]
MVATAVAVTTLCVAGCTASDPLDGLGGDGLAARCADESLPRLEDAVLQGCNGGEGQGQFAVSLDTGGYDLLVLCEDAEKVSIVTDADGPIPVMVRTDCPEGADPVRVHVADLEAPVDTIVKVAQQGEGESAWFLVPE